MEKYCEITTGRVGSGHHSNHPPEGPVLLIFPLPPRSPFVPLDAEPAPTPVNFGELLTLYEQENLPERHSTQSSYRSNLRRLRQAWGSTRVDWLCGHPLEIQHWVRGLQTLPKPGGGAPRPLSRKTKKNLKAILHRLFECAMAWGFVSMQRNPIDFVWLRGLEKKSTARTVLTIDQFDRLLRDRMLPPHCRMMAQLAMMTGMRISEILGLRWEDVDFRAGVLQLHRGIVGPHQGPLKSNSSEADVPMHSILASALENWRRSVPPLNGWVFGSPRTGRPYHRDALQADHLRPAGKRLGIDDLGWHSFRHTYRALLRDLETPLEVQQYLMRHAAITTTMGYGKFGPDRVRVLQQANARVVELLPQFGGIQ